MGSYYYSNHTAPVWPGYAGWTGYGYMPAPQVTYLPRIRQNPALQPFESGHPQPPNQDLFQSHSPSPEPVVPTETASQPAVPPSPSAKTPEKTAPPPAPQTFAEEVGDQVGGMVTRLIEENPQWEQKLRDMDVQKYLSDPNTLLSGVHEAYQNTPMLKWTSKQFSNQLVKALPDQFEPVAMQVVDWLNSPLKA